MDAFANFVRFPLAFDWNFVAVANDVGVDLVGLRYQRRGREHHGEVVGLRDFYVFIES